MCCNRDARRATFHEPGVPILQDKFRKFLQKVRVDPHPPTPKVESYKFSWLEEFPIHDWCLWPSCDREAIIPASSWSKIGDQVIWGQVHRESSDSGVVASFMGLSKRFLRPGGRYKEIP